MSIQLAPAIEAKIQKRIERGHHPMDDRVLDLSPTEAAVDRINRPRPSGSPAG